MTKCRLHVLISLILACILVQCSTDAPRDGFDYQGREVPQFSADTAYAFIESQVGFGPRNPNSEGHRLAGDFLRDKLQSYAGVRNVYVQSFVQDGYDEELQMRNIIAAFNPDSSDRILLAAHWDTRPRGENDPDQPNDPIPGADDGGSGVGVLLELARLFNEQPPPLGVDMILFDGEDYGESGSLGMYFLGARYWGANQPVPGYSPRFGILLDMVGGESAYFPKERNSMNYASGLVDRIWEVADSMGHGNLFADESGSFISDDHVIVQRLTGIDMINIINHRSLENGQTQFPSYWHSHQDNMEVIDKGTLQAVGDVLAEFIYNQIE